MKISAGGSRKLKTTTTTVVAGFIGNQMVTIENKTKCLIDDYNELFSAVRWFIENCVEKRKYVLRKEKKSLARLIKMNRAGYPFIRIYQKKIVIHRLLMSYWKRRPLGEDEIVHHKNGNKEDSRCSNLEILSNSLHSTLHHKGVPKPPGFSKKISEANRKRKGMLIRKDVTAEKVKELLLKGKTINQMKDILDSVDYSIKARIENNPELKKIFKEKYIKYYGVRT